MMRRSIRWRLTAWYSMALAAALMLFGVLIRFSLERRLVAEIDADLAGRAARFQAYFLEEAAEKDTPVELLDELGEFCASLPPGSFIELSGPAEPVFHYPASGGQARSARTLARGFTNAKGTRFEMVLGESTEAVKHTIALLGLQLLTMTPLAVLLACFGGWLLSRRALKPVGEMANAARAISIDNLSMRLNVARTGDELEALGEAFNTMLGRLEAAVNTLSQFVADASHELRTPLSVIRASAEIALRRARSGESYRESLAGIAAETERMTALVEDLLFLARADAGAASVPETPGDLNTVIAEAARTVGHMAEARGVRVCAMEADGRVLVPMHAASLKRMFVALLENAIKNSPAGGEVRTEARAMGEAAVVSIRDLGGGIAPEDLPHIFKRFYRADKARTGEGYGLGLAIAESIARAHRAAIEVKSAPGEGSTFTVTMPGIRECPAPAELEAASRAS